MKNFSGNKNEWSHFTGSNNIDNDRLTCHFTQVSTLDRWSHYWRIFTLFYYEHKKIFPKEVTLIRWSLYQGDHFSKFHCILNFQLFGCIVFAQLYPEVPDNDYIYIITNALKDV